MFEIYYNQQLILVTDTLEDCVNFAMNLHLKSNVPHDVIAKSTSPDGALFEFKIYKVK